MKTDKTDKRKKEMLKALEKTLGVVTTACNMINISRETHYNWLKTDPEYADKVEQLENISLDFAEAKLYKLIEQGETAAVIFFLKTKGKRRGYIEKVQTELSGELNFKDKIKSLSDEEIKQRLKELEK